MTSYFSSYSSLYLEAVQKPEKYLDILIEKLKNLKTQIQLLNFTATKLCDFLSKEFNDDKIIFVFKNNGDKLIISAEYDAKSNNIYIFCDTQLKQIQNDNSKYTEFILLFRDLVGHELIHRLQFINDRTKKVQEYDINNKKGLIKYLSDKKEIMAHAWQIIQGFKLFGQSNDDIFNIIKFINNKTKLAPIYKTMIRYNIILNYYLDNFNKNDSVMKRLFKYIFEYLN